MDKCICGKDIFPTPMFKDLAECMYCYRLYKLGNNKWARIDKREFRDLYIARLIKKNWEVKIWK